MNILFLIFSDRGESKSEATRGTLHYLFEGVMPFLQVRITSGRSGGGEGEGDSKVRGERKPPECMLDYINSKMMITAIK